MRDNPSRFCVSTRLVNGSKLVESLHDVPVQENVGVLGPEEVHVVEVLVGHGLGLDEVGQGLGHLGHVSGHVDDVVLPVVDGDREAGARNAVGGWDGTAVLAEVVLGTAVERLETA